MELTKSKLKRIIKEELENMYEFEQEEADATDVETPDAAAPSGLDAQGNKAAATIKALLQNPQAKLQVVKDKIARMGEPGAPMRTSALAMLFSTLGVTPVDLVKLRQKGSEK